MRCYTEGVRDVLFGKLAEDSSGAPTARGNDLSRWLPERGKDVLRLVDDDSPAKAPDAREPWVIAVIDDDPIVHEVTKAVLADFMFDGRGVRFLSARSGQEAQKLFRTHHDIAVAVIDVVMETELAGLDLVRFVRDELNCTLTRLILRTGQPGLAPESRIIHDYDLHDYWEKTDLSAQKMITGIHSALRAYRDLRILEASRHGIHKLLDMLPSLQTCQSRDAFIRSAFAQLKSFMNLSQVKGFVGEPRADGIHLVHVEGMNFATGTVLPAGVADERRIAKALQADIVQDAHALSLRLNAREAVPFIFYLEGSWDLGEEGLRLLGLFRHQMEMQLENLCLWLDAVDAQLETIHLLADAVESRSKETGAHTRRVGEMAWILAGELGMDTRRCELIHHAAPLHDLGKIAVPDSILNKPGKLDTTEWAVMMTHAQVGYEILSKSDRSPMKMAALIAREHHEKWDGTGYPNHLSGNQISQEGRIVALVDVVDALLSRRCYKDPWKLDDVLGLLKEQRGKHFDPSVVDAFFRNLPSVLALRQSYPDEN